MERLTIVTFEVTNVSSLQLLHLTCSQVEHSRYDNIIADICFSYQGRDLQVSFDLPELRTKSLA